MPEYAITNTQDNRFEQMLSRISSKSAVESLLLPALGIFIFLVFWQFCANRIDTSLGQFPGPAEVWEQVQGLERAVGGVEGHAGPRQRLVQREYRVGAAGVVSLQQGGRERRRGRAG